MSDTTFGSAHWNTWEGYEKDDVLNGNHIFFGENYHDTSKCFSIIPKQHFLTIGSNRSGKGATQIIPNLLTYQGSALVIDPKGENAYITAPARRKMGQNVYILDPWGEVNRRFGSKSGEMEEFATFNPLSLLNPNSYEYTDDLAYIADALIINEGKEPHWDNSARELVAGIIAFCVETYGEKANLNMVRKQLIMPQSGIAALAQTAQDLGGESAAARKLARFQNAESKELSGIISTAVTQTAILDNAALSKSMAESSFSFSDLTEGEATVYLVLPTDKLQTYGRWLRLMISIGIRTISRNIRDLKNPVLFLLDEFGTIGKLSAISQAVGLMAGLKMCVWAFVQDINQLKRDYPQEWETFIANAQAVSVLNVMDNFTADYVSKMLGITTEEVISVRTAQEREKRKLFGKIFKIDTNYSSMDDKIYQRPLMTADEVRRLPSDGGILITKVEPIIFQKLPYYTDEYFASKCRPDPYYPAPEDLIKKRREEKQKCEEKKRKQKQKKEEKLKKYGSYILPLIFIFYMYRFYDAFTNPSYQGGKSASGTLLQMTLILVFYYGAKLTAQENKPQKYLRIGFTGYYFLAIVFFIFGKFF